MGDEADEFLGDRRSGIDDRLDTGLQNDLLEFAVLDTRDRSLKTERAGGLACENVRSVVVGYGEEDVGPFDAGSTKNARTRTVALDDLCVQPFPEMRRSMGIGLHDGDVVAFRDETLCEMRPVRSSPDDHDPHVFSRTPFVARLVQRTTARPAPTLLA
jgi:hypothetical protein